MLIEFSVENFRSVRERQTLSLAAAPKLRRVENTVRITLRGDKIPPILKVAAVYGPNASGKSTLIKALGLTAVMSRRQPSPSPKPLPISPFRFDKELEDKPSRFELHFIEKETRYSFEWAATSERIHFERLIAYPDGRQTELYTRQFANGVESYEFSPELEGGVELHEAWKKLTAPQLFFLSQAVANSSEELQQLRKPFFWLSESILTVDAGMSSFVELTKRLIADIPRFGGNVAEILADIDVPVTDIKSELGHGPQLDPEVLDRFKLLPDTAKAIRSKAPVRTTLKHRSSLGEAEFDLEEESEGTKNIVGFALPWLLMQAPGTRGVPEPVRILVVDELDSSLHPKVVEALVAKHLKGGSGCQLIFTTHDTHLMDTKLLRRDQIWMTERDRAGATQLRCVHDFEGRESEDVEKRYYEGKYRALPMIRNR